MGEETSPRSFAKVANFVGLGGLHQVGFNLGFKGVWLGFEMLSSPKLIFLGPIKFPRFKRLNNDVITRS